MGNPVRSEGVIVCDKGVESVCEGGRGGSYFNICCDGCQFRTKYLVCWNVHKWSTQHLTIVIIVVNLGSQRNTWIEWNRWTNCKFNHIIMVCGLLN